MKIAFLEILTEEQTGPARLIAKAFVGGGQGSIPDCVKTKTLNSGLGFQLYNLYRLNSTK